MRMIDFTYKILTRYLLFKMDPEFVHNIALKNLKFASKFSFLKRVVGFVFSSEKPFEYLGLKFKNPIGLAAGFDKNAEVFDFIEALGFGFCEVGSVSLRPQKGNIKPRIFRVVDEYAIINHIGLENDGAYVLAKNIEKKKHKVSFPLGINIVKNNDVDFKNAASNISECFSILKDLGDFFVFNISCPNVEGIKYNVSSYIEDIAEKLTKYNLKKPIFVKISPDLNDEDVYSIISVSRKCSFGLVATNTTKRRDLLKTRLFDNISGGLSGRPISSYSLDMIKRIRSLDKDIDIIAVGGISSSSDIKARADLGVKLFEIYTSLIYEGPTIVKKICKSI